MRLTLLLRLAVVALIVVASMYFLTGGRAALTEMIEASGRPEWLWLICTCLLYSAILMIPFAPGLELGLLIMAMFGVVGIVGAWLSTLVGLTLAFLVGRYFEHTQAVNWFVSLLHQAEVRQRALRWVIDKFTQWPYLAIGLLLNVPGNVVIGGGGGISLAAGALGHLRLGYFVLAVAVATSILPILLLTGILALSDL